MELDSSRIKSTSAAPRKQHRKHTHPLSAILQLSALSFRELNRKINLFIETEVKKKKKNSDERALKVGKEDRGKVCWEISRGQDVGLSVE